MNENQKLGRPEIEIDMEQLAIFCRLKPTLSDCADFFKCSEDTIEKRIREATVKTFTEFRRSSETVEPNRRRKLPGLV